MIGFGVDLVRGTRMRVPIPENMNIVMFRKMPGRDCPVIAFEGSRMVKWRIMAIPDKFYDIPEKMRMVNIRLISGPACYVEVVFGQASLPVLHNS